MKHGVKYTTSAQLAEGINAAMQQLANEELDAAAASAERKVTASTLAKRKPAAAKPTPETKPKPAANTAEPASKPTAKTKTTSTSKSSSAKKKDTDEQPPAASATTWTAVPHPEAALDFLALLRRHCGDRVTAFEILSRNCLDLVTRHIPGARDPLPKPHEWYVLAELSDSHSGERLRHELERALESAMESALVNDAVVAENEAQARALWRLRETVPEAAREEPGMLYRHDISVAVSRIPAFIREAHAALGARFPGANVICFGHLGDGNLHYNAFIPGRKRSDAAAREAQDVTTFVYDIVHRYDGSFSAEHGIGLAKVNDMVRYKSAIELELMTAIKGTLDPHGIMNPGKVLELRSPVSL